jgi:hypothetical protein
VLSLGVRPRLEAHIESMLLSIEPDEGRGRGGIGDSLVGLKYRLLDEADAIPAVLGSLTVRQEFRLEVFRESELTELRLLVEAHDAAPALLVREALRAGLGIRVDVVPVPVGSLPRWDLKAGRVVRA